VVTQMKPRTRGLMIMRISLEEMRREAKEKRPKRVFAPRI